MLRIEDMSLAFSRYEKKGVRKKNLKIIFRFNLSVCPGQVVAVVGSSGAGKSLLAHAILSILPKNVKIGGKMIFKGEELSEERKKLIRGKEIVLVPQSVNCLNPLVTAGDHIYRSACLTYGKRGKSREKKSEVMSLYGLDEAVCSLYPFQLSGGMTRRVFLAMAAATEADLIISDEPTTGLDPSAAEDSLSRLRGLADKGKGVILITHDLRMALKFSDVIAVFYGGTTVEIALPDDFSEDREPRHPYSRILYESLPDRSFARGHKGCPGIHSARHGCVYEPCCPDRVDLCSLSPPPCKKIFSSSVWCHNA